MNKECPYTDTQEEPLYDEALFLEEVTFAEEEIAATALIEFASTRGIVASMRPTIQTYALRTHGNPSESTAPIRYNQALLAGEVMLRRAIARGVGHMAIAPLLARALDIIDNGAGPIDANEQPFELDITRGRVHEGKRGRIVRTADDILRSVCTDTLVELGDTRLAQDIAPTFTDASMRIRHLASTILDLKFGTAWLDLDQSHIASMKVKEIAGKKIGRHDRQLLLRSQQLTDVRVSLGNAVASAAEFTAIGIEHLQKALARDGVAPSAWYPYAFANIRKVGFAARLPFWTAQDIGINANDPDAELLFSTAPLSNGMRDIFFADPAHQKYYDKGLAAGCSGIVPLRFGFLRQNLLRTMSSFVHKVGTLARIADKQLSHDWSDNTSLKVVTGADAATAVCLGLALSNQYNFTDKP